MHQVAIISPPAPAKKNWLAPVALFAFVAMVLCLLGVVVYFAISALRGLQLVSTHHWLVWVALFFSLSVYLGFKRKFVR